MLADDAVELVLGLVERSLVVRPDASGEYRMLDTLRTFARDRAPADEAAADQAAVLDDAGFRSYAK